MPVELAFYHFHSLARPFTLLTPYSFAVALPSNMDCSTLSALASLSVTNPLDEEDVLARLALAAKSALVGRADRQYPPKQIKCAVALYSAGNHAELEKIRSRGHFASAAVLAVEIESRLPLNINTISVVEGLSQYLSDFLNEGLGFTSLDQPAPSAVFDIICGAMIRDHPNGHERVRSWFVLELSDVLGAIADSAASLAAEVKPLDPPDLTAGSTAVKMLASLMAFKRQQDPTLPQMLLPGEYDDLLTVTRGMALIDNSVAPTSPCGVKRARTTTTTLQSPTLNSGSPAPSTLAGFDDEKDNAFQGNPRQRRRREGCEDENFF
ncbi:hypothetical protein B0H17DRAFT_381926 [Mycena rosella]|uniref:Uncharacterized protein n=1 Tax=Mycena rosella TaxID=1033263 RepID=A0AAD7CNK3_MYCRO|nr:hypothetical protein B0H17DRAFT_381926 [Mycena rosella]